MTESVMSVEVVRWGRGERWEREDGGRKSVRKKLSHCEIN
jgi:hypothetical protein